MTQRYFSNTSTVGQLTAPVAGSATSLTTSGLVNLPTVPFTITIDRNTASEEICLVTAVLGSSLTVTRGFDGTAQTTHAAGATIEHTAGAIDYNEASAHTNATTGVHGTTGALVGSSGSQTIFGKTIVSPLLQGSTSDGDAAVLFIPAGVSRNMLRGVDAGGVDRIVADSGGNLTAQSLSSTGNTTVHGALTVQGATNAAAVTATGLVTLSGGATVPTGKNITLTDAPSGTTSAVNKAYADGLGTSAATASTIARRDSSGRLQIADPSAGADAATKNYVDAASATASATYRATATKTLSSGAASTSFTWSSSSGATGSNTYMSYASGVFTVLKAGAYAYSFRADSDSTVAGYSVAALNVGGAAGGVDPALIDRRQRSSGYPGSGQLTQNVTATAFLPAGATLQPLGAHGTSDGSSVAYTLTFTYQYLGS